MTFRPSNRTKGGRASAADGWGRIGWRVYLPDRDRLHALLRWRQLNSSGYLFFSLGNRSHLPVFFVFHHIRVRKRRVTAAATGWFGDIALFRHEPKSLLRFCRSPSSRHVSNSHCKLQESRGSCQGGSARKLWR